MMRLLFNGGLCAGGATVAAIIIAFVGGGAFEMFDVLFIPLIVVFAPGDAIARYFIPDAHDWSLFPFWIGTNVLIGVLCGGLIGLLRRIGLTGRDIHRRRDNVVGP